MKRHMYRAGLLLIWGGAAVMAQLATTPLEMRQQILDKQAKGMGLFEEDHQGRLVIGPPAKSITSGRWWSNPDTAQRLNLTADQLKKMDDVFQQYRIQLIDLKAGLEKAEAMLEPLVAADQPDDAKVVAQIDRVAQARADLEKVNSRMLWSIRRVLTPEQWKNLQTQSPKPRIVKGPGKW
jgi:Spy/CpxP family protein refolding chaperone